MIKVGGLEHTTEENVRLKSTIVQIKELVYRARLVRNSVLSYTIAVALFILTSLLLGVSSVLSIGKLNFFILSSFLLGMIFVLLGVVYAALETKKGYDIIVFEVKAHE
jgi:hypothetical protein